jgi:hypothetical protein
VEAADPVVARGHRDQPLGMVVVQPHAQARAPGGFHVVEVRDERERVRSSATMTAGERNE